MTSPTLNNPRIQWRAIEPNTLRAYEQAARDFQKVTGYPMKQATLELALTWQESMKARDFAPNTIRQRLSALATMSGVRVDLPKRERTEPVYLQDTQIRTMMSLVQDRAERMLLVRLLTLGSQARIVSALSDNSFMAHLIGAEREHTLGTQKVTRLLKRIASKAGLNAKQVNLRVWCLSGRRLIETLSPAELSSLLDARVQQNGKVVDFVKPLHGIGRRSFAKSVAK